MIAADDERAIARVIDDVFILTDRKDWATLRALFVDGPVAVDMSSLAGGGPVEMSADVLLAGFTVGLHANKLTHHMTTNLHVALTGDAAVVTLHGYAWNKLADRPDLWETWGTYTLRMRRQDSCWKIAGFRYDAKATRGDDGIRTHTQAG
jgi:hypothetical protein